MTGWQAGESSSLGIMTRSGGDRSLNAAGPRNWGDAESRNTERLFELHDESGVHTSGYEVASHSFRHEWIPGMGCRRPFYSLERSEDALEQYIGGPVVTFVPPHNQPFD